MFKNVTFIPVIKHKLSYSITPVSHDPLEIILMYWYGAPKTFLIITNVESNCNS